MPTTTPKPKLIPALAKAIATMPAVPKNGWNPKFKSNYMLLEDVVATLRPHLAEHDLIFAQIPEPTGEIETVAVRTKVFHRDGESLDLGMVVVPATPISKTPMPPTAHSAGSGYTYARRYGLCIAFGLVDIEDDDGNAAVDNGDRSHGRPVAAPANGAGAFFAEVVKRTKLDEDDARALARDLCNALGIDARTASAEEWSEVMRAMNDIDDLIAYVGESRAAAEAADPNGR